MNGMAQALAALVLAPGFGGWSNEHYSGSTDIAALRSTGVAVGVNVFRIERSFIQAANDKAKRKAKPKPQTAAKPKPKGTPKAQSRSK